MVQLTPADLDRIRAIQARCQALMTTGFYFSPNLGYEIRKDATEDEVRTAFADANHAAVEIGQRYGITVEVLWNDLKPANHPFFDFVLVMNHLGYAMRLAHISVHPRP